MFKTGAGGSGEITDPARIRAFVEEPDATLPTEQAVWDQSSHPTIYYIHFDSGTRFFSTQYDSHDGVLTVAADGFSIKPGQAFAALVAAMPEATFRELRNASGSRRSVRRLRPQTPPWA